MNTVNNENDFLKNISKGKWDKVLEDISKMYLPKEKLIFLYEQIIFEMIELREIDTAKELFKLEIISNLQFEDEKRYEHISRCIEHPYFDSTIVYEDGSNKERRRNELVNLLSNEICCVESNRLLVLLGEALKWEEHIV